MLTYLVPGSFRKGNQAWKELRVSDRHVTNKFGPELGLHSDDVFGSCQRCEGVSDVVKIFSWKTRREMRTWRNEPGCHLFT